jgi:hypothetical protein
MKLSIALLFVCVLQPPTAEGRVDVVGVEPLLTIVLRTSDPKHPILLDGPLMTQLRHVNGLDVLVTGRRHDRFITVDSFKVMSANGVPATDGTLASAGDTLILVTDDGIRHPLVHPSPTLRSEVGGRIWVSGPLDREPVAYGLIDNSPANSDHSLSSPSHPPAP